MKKLSLLLLLFSLTGALAATHQPGRDHSTLELADGKVTVEYGTPKLGDRNLDEMIVPGSPWRLGMNDATTLETTIDLSFGGKKLAAGKYVLVARADAQKNWTLLASSGTSGRFDATAVALETPLQSETGQENEDLLKITLSAAGRGGTLTIAWGTKRLHTTFTPAN